MAKMFGRITGHMWARAGKVTISRCFVALAAAWLLMAAMSAAQNRNSGEIRGTVSDPTGAVLPDTEITIQNTQTGVLTVLKSDKDGIYDAESLIPGLYAVSFEKDGFKKTVVRNIDLHVEAITVDGKLQVGGTATTVNVDADGTLIQTETSDTRETINAKTVQDLPSVGQNWTTFTSLLPGVNGGTSNAPNYSGGSGGEGVGVNGQGGYLYNWTQDGGESSVAVQVDLLITPIDAIGEVNFKTSNFSAEYSNGMAQFSVITKSGTNQFHGSLFEFNQSTVFDARNAFVQAPQAKPPVHWNNFGGSIGGPIHKDKAFFFFDYLRNPNHSSTGGLLTFPTALERTGDFSASDVPGITLPVIYDPASTKKNPDGSYSRTPFPGNKIPTGEIDQAALNILKYYPAPNHAAATGTYNSSNYSWQMPIPVDTSTYTAKVDYNFSPSNRMNASSMHVIQPGPWGSWDAPIDNVLGYIHEDTDQVSDVWTINSNFVNEARVSAGQEIGQWSRYDQGKDWGTILGIPNLTDQIFPDIQPAGIQGIGTAFTSATDDAIRFDYADTATLVKGKHILKFGGEYDRWGDTACWTCASAGTFNFSGVFTEDPNNPDGTGNGFADFLLGQSSSWSDGWALTNYARLKNVQAFAQDDYKVRRNLTLNLGMRYYIPLGWSEKKNNMGGFDPNIMNPATGTLGAMWYAPMDNGKTRTRLENTIFNGFGPRIGFAYSPAPTWSFRGGYGIFDQNLDVGNYNSGIGVATNPSASASTTDGITPVSILSQGHAPPAIPTFPPSPSQYNGNSVPYVPRSISMMTLQQWNFTVEHEFLNQILVSVGYAGNKGTNLINQRDINQVPLATVKQVWQSGVNMQQYRPYPQYQGIAYLGTDGWSNYNSLQVSVTKKLTHGVWMTSNYTWSHGLDTGSFNGWTGGAGPLQDQSSISSSYGNSDQDTRHSWNGGVTYDLPVGKGRDFLNQGGPLDYIIGGWALSSTWIKSSGRPFTPVMSGTNTDQTLSGELLPDRTCNGKGSSPSVNQWFNYNCFSAPALLSFGNSGRNILVGPGYDMLSAAMSKRFAIPLLGEKASFEIRGEFFDLPNFKNYGQPNPYITPQPVNAPPVATTAGVISSAFSNRTGQVGGRFTF